MVVCSKGNCLYTLFPLVVTWSWLWAPQVTKVPRLTHGATPVSGSHVSGISPAKTFSNQRHLGCWGATARQTSLHAFGNLKPRAFCLRVRFTFLFWFFPPNSQKRGKKIIFFLSKKKKKSQNFVNVTNKSFYFFPKELFHYNCCLSAIMQHEIIFLSV